MQAARGISRRIGRDSAAALAGLAVLLSLAASQSTWAAASAAPSAVDLSTYVRVGRFDLPEPTRTSAPAGILLAKEASAVTYDWDTDTLFVVGDGGTAVVQVSKSGQLIDFMTLAAGGSPQGTEFYDTEGITYVGGGRFVLTEERYRQANLFTYAAGTTLNRSDVQTVKLGTTLGNIGIEGISNDPLSGGYVVVKETQPEGIFQTGIDFAAGTATNGSPTTENSTNLFDPALAGLSDFSDVFALSNLPSLNASSDFGHLLILSQESGRIVEIDRSGNVSSSLTIVADPGNPLSVPDQTNEGVTMDRDGALYVVNENGGGDPDHPQLWVYAPSSAQNQAPTAVALNNRVTSIPENTSTATRLKVADVAVTDDGIGTNNLSVTGPDAASFEVDSTGLFIKAGVVLDFETKASYDVTVAVDDPGAGGSPDATVAFHLDVTDVVNENPQSSSVIVSEVVPWGNGNTTYNADWFELTNTGGDAVDLTGWKMDDNSNSFGSAVALNGVTNLGPGRSAIFVEGTPATASAFLAAWFGTAVPDGYLIGSYTGGGVGLGTGGDAVNIFDSFGNRATGVSFGVATTGFSFDNAAGLGSATLPLPTIATLSVAGVKGAFVAADGQETGSPGVIAAHAAVTEVAPWGSGNSPYMADWFEVTNTGGLPIDLTGWKIDDNSNSFGSAVALRGVQVIPAGTTAIFLEGNATGSTDATIGAAFANAWFGSPAVPAGLLVGGYGGSGVGLATSGDALNLFDSAGNRVTGISFAASTTGFSFDNTAALGSTTLPLPVISTVSVAGVNRAFLAADGIETGSPFPETTPPTISASATPAPNADGWNNTDVTVSFTCTDTGSGVNQAASSLADVVLAASGSATGTCIDRAGNSATATYSAKIDKTAPTVAYSGNAGTYGVLGTVAITCSATDALSGVASSTCADATGPAWTFGAGPHTLTATATDRAGNSGSGSTAFTVVVRAADLATLTKRFVQGSARYQALRPLQKAAVDLLVTAATRFLLELGPAQAPAQKARFVDAYQAGVQSLARGGWLSAAQASTLSSLADAI